MSSALPNQIILQLTSTLKAFISKNQIFLLSLLPLVLSTSARASTTFNLLLAQQPPIAQTSNEQLPLPPVNQDPLTVPPVNNGVNNGGNPTYEFQAPQNPQYYQTAPTPQYNQYNQAFERYSVLVDASGYNGQLLPVVKQVEPSAYIRNFGGRSVIQAGVFSRQQNAVLRIQQLLASGINFSNVRLVNATSGQEIAITPAGGSIGGSYGGYYGGYVTNVNNQVNQNRSSYYYVAIPASSQDLPEIEQRIWRSFGQSLNNVGVQRRNQPRGSHIAVGPFARRADAEQWNAAMRNIGLGNARVYYGN